MTNKEVSEKFQEMLLTQDIQLVSKLCAGFFLDLNRFLNIEEESESSREYLKMRVSFNISEVFKAIKLGDFKGIIITPASHQGKGDA